MSSQPSSSMPRSGARAARIKLDYAVERRCSIVRDVERDLHAVVSAGKASARKRAQAAVAFADRPRDGAGAPQDRCSPVRR